jgi:hypothetical protein
LPAARRPIDAKRRAQELREKIVFRRESCVVAEPDCGSNQGEAAEEPAEYDFKETPSPRHEKSKLSVTVALSDQRGE